MPHRSNILYCMCERKRFFTNSTVIVRVTKIHYDITRCYLLKIRNVPTFHVLQCTKGVQVP